MLGLYKETKKLPFWDGADLHRRRALISSIAHQVQESLTKLNPAWTMHEMEGPCLIPSEMIHPGYAESGDVFEASSIPAGKLSLRPETTASSYAYARHLLQTGWKAPLCVWQAGKSFRKETNDGASVKKLRFYEFNQLEFQCFYSKNTKANYREAVTKAVSGLFPSCRIVESDRLPAYSIETMDLEFPAANGWREIASISTRTDFSESLLVLEVAFGLDRLVVLTDPEKLLPVAGEKQ